MLKPPQFDPEEQRRDAQRLISRLFSDDDEGDGDKGPYQVIRELGRGGMGVVHLAFDQDLHRHVAIKTVRDPGNRELLRRLVDEARAMAKVEHPNVCRVYALAHDQDDVAIVMEYVDGQTLRAWLDEQPHAEAEILAVFRDAGEGLAAIHAKGLVHRDFKPTNVMVDRQGRVLVMDLGLACRDPAHDETRFADDDLLEPEPIAGTPAYMAPEQRRGGLATAKSDQYAFCIALADAVSYPGSDWLRLILDRGRRTDPSQRFASMRALLDRLAVGAEAAEQSRVTLKVTLSCRFEEFDEDERTRIQELLRLVTRDPYLCVENVVAGSVVLEVNVSLAGATMFVGQHREGMLLAYFHVSLDVSIHEVRDEILLEVWQSGGKAAGDLLFERYYEAVSRFFTSKIGSAHAHELTQTTFIMVQHSRCRDRPSVRALMYSIARNVLLSYIARRKRSEQHFDPDVNSVHDIDPTPLSPVEREKQEHILLAALRRLPLDLQIMIELYNVDNLTFLEIAWIVEKPPHTIKRHSHRGRLLLDRLMIELAESPEASASDERKTRPQKIDERDEGGNDEKSVAPNLDDEPS